MRSFLLSDCRDSVIGMRLAGIEGDIVLSKDEAKRALDGLLENEDTGILFLTQNVAQWLEDEVYEIRKNRISPLISVIPDRFGFKDYQGISHYIKEAVGI